MNLNAINILKNDFNNFPEPGNRVKDFTHSTQFSDFLKSHIASIDQTHDNLESRNDAIQKDAAHDIQKQNKSSEIQQPAEKEIKADKNQDTEKHTTEKGNVSNDVKDEKISEKKELSTDKEETDKNENEEFAKLNPEDMLINMLNKNNEKSSIKKNSDTEKTKAIDFENLLNELNKLIDINQKDPGAGETEKLKTSLMELQDLLKSGKNQPEHVLMKELLAKIKSFLKNLNTEQLKPGTMKSMESFLFTLKEVVNKISSKSSTKNSRLPGDFRADQSATVAADLSQKIESLLDTMKGDGFTRSSGDEGSGNNFNFSMSKFDGIGRKGANQATVQLKSSSFSENLQNMIQSARVVVRDGRNGTFALKLYPRELGSVNINLGLEHGIINGRFLVENNDARDLILQNLENIKQQLQDAGVTVGEFQVNVQHQGENLQDAQNDQIIYNLQSTESNEIISSEYESHARMSHNGSLDVTI